MLEERGEQGELQEVGEEKPRSAIFTYDVHLLFVGGSYTAD